MMNKTLYLKYYTKLQACNNTFVHGAILYNFFLLIELTITGYIAIYNLSFFGANKMQI